MVPPGYPEEVFPGIFRLRVPLPENPLVSVNSYLVRGDDRSLLIDTGMHRPECLEAIEGGLSRLGTPLSSVDCFITHSHPDHIGLAPLLVEQGSRIFAGRQEADAMRAYGDLTRLATEARANGLSEEDLQNILEDFPGRLHDGVAALDVTFLGDGDHLRYGPYDLACVWTPGHTRGHLCLYEARARLLFSGDHVLDRITPNISGWLYDGDALRDYLDSLELICGPATDWVLPGHDSPFRDLTRRVSEIRAHHEERADEVLSILALGPQTAVEVASRMSWEVRCSGWEAVPSSQRWFAGGEALAHLEYLWSRGRVGREMNGGTTVFCVAG